MKTLNTSTLNNFIDALISFRDQHGGDKMIFISNYEQKNICWNLPSRGNVLAIDKDNDGHANVLLKIKG